MKFLAAAARSSGKVNALVEGGSTSAGFGEPGATRTSFDASFPSEKAGDAEKTDVGARGTTAEEAGRSGAISLEPATSVVVVRVVVAAFPNDDDDDAFSLFVRVRVPSRSIFATVIASPDATAGSAAAPETRTADATHANAAARARSVHVSRSPSGRRASEARLVAFASARARKPRRDARDATRRREASRRAPTAAKGARAWGTAHATIASAARRAVRTPAAASRHALRAFAAPPSVPRKKARESDIGKAIFLASRFGLKARLSSEKLTRVGKYPPNAVEIFRLPTRVKKIESRPRLSPTRHDLANRKLSNSNSGELRVVGSSRVLFSALEREEERAAELASAAQAHARRTRKRTEAKGHERG